MIVVLLCHSLVVINGVCFLGLNHGFAVFRMVGSPLVA